MGHLSNTIGFILLSTVLYQVYRLVSERLLHRKLYRTHQCKPIPRYQHTDGFRRKAFGQRQVEAYAAGRAAPFAQSLFREYGKTWLETSWNRTIVHTCDPKNIQDVAATSFGDFGLQPLREGLSAPFMQYLDSSTEFFLGDSVEYLLPESPFNAQEFLPSFDDALKGVGQRLRLGRLRFLHLWNQDWKNAYT